jgi:NhaP-type Na+/H+ or K+/H+ antiporter
MGSVGLLGSDDLLACFIAGNSFTWDDWFREETEDAHLTEVIDMLLNLSIFVYIGITMVCILIQRLIMVHGLIIFE